MFGTYLVSVFCDYSCIIRLVHCVGMLIKEGMCLGLCCVNNSSSSGNYLTVVEILYPWLLIYRY